MASGETSPDAAEVCLSRLQKALVESLNVKQSFIELEISIA